MSMNTPLDLPEAQYEVGIFLRTVKSGLKWLTFSTALGLWLCGTVLFVLGFVLLDHWWPGGLSNLTCTLSGTVYLVVSAAWLVTVPGWLLVRRLNDLYAARLIERAHPEVHNTIVDAIQLSRRADLAGSIRAAVVSRAADELAGLAIAPCLPRRRLWQVSTALVAGLAAFIVYALISPKPVGPSIRRAFGSHVPAPTRVRIVDLGPADGTSVVRGEPVEFFVELRGYVPSSVYVQFSADDGATWLDGERLELSVPAGQSDSGHRWTGTKAGSDVQRSFCWQVIAGDARSELRRLHVRPVPAVIDIHTRYDFPKYTGLPPTTQPGGNIDVLTGTKVTIYARTNVPVRDPLLVEGTGVGQRRRAMSMPLQPGELIEGRLDVERDDVYELAFADTYGAVNRDSIQYQVRARPDAPPSLDVRQPAVDELPADGFITVEAVARDDFGLSQAAFFWRAMKGGRSGNVPLLLEVDSSSADGPRAIIEKQIPLSQVDVKPGESIECWLSVWDNREDAMERPAHQRTDSPVRMIRVLEPPRPVVSPPGDESTPNKRGTDRADRSAPDRPAQSQPAQSGDDRLPGDSKPAEKQDGVSKPNESQPADTQPASSRPGDEAKSASGPPANVTDRHADPEEPAPDEAAAERDGNSAAADEDTTDRQSDQQSRPDDSDAGGEGKEEADPEQEERNEELDRQARLKEFADRRARELDAIARHLRSDSDADEDRERHNNDADSQAGTDGAQDAARRDNEQRDDEGRDDQRREAAPHETGDTDETKSAGSRQGRDSSRRRSREQPAEQGQTQTENQSQEENQAQEQGQSQEPPPQSPASSRESQQGQRPGQQARTQRPPESQPAQRDQTLPAEQPAGDSLAQGQSQEQSQAPEQSQAQEEGTPQEQSSQSSSASAQSLGEQGQSQGQSESGEQPGANGQGQGEREGEGQGEGQGQAQAEGQGQGEGKGNRGEQGQRQGQAEDQGEGQGQSDGPQGLSQEGNTALQSGGNANAPGLGADGSGSPSKVPDKPEDDRSEKIGNLPEPERKAEKIDPTGRVSKLMDELEMALRRDEVDPELLESLGWNVEQAWQFVEDYRREVKGAQPQVNRSELPKASGLLQGGSGGRTGVDRATGRPARAARSLQATHAPQADEVKQLREVGRQRVPRRLDSILRGYYSSLNQSSPPPAPASVPAP